MIRVTLEMDGNSHRFEIPADDEEAFRSVLEDAKRFEENLSEDENQEDNPAELLASLAFATGILFPSFGEQS